MQETLDIDDALLRLVMHTGQFKTPGDAVRAGLNLLVQQHRVVVPGMSRDAACHAPEVAAGLSLQTEATAVRELASKKMGRGHR